MKTTLSPLDTWMPAIWNSTMAAPTMRMRPSVSNPNCVIQLKKLINLEPRVPNDARLIANAVVPVSGPWSEASPSKKNERLPMMMRLSATLKLKPKPISNAP